jgi:hypothetical protein
MTGDAPPILTDKHHAADSIFRRFLDPTPERLERRRPAQLSQRE